VLEVKTEAEVLVPLTFPFDFGPKIRQMSELGGKSQNDFSID